MHRDDIDGLRTLAVLPVVAFHFMILPRLFGGGFVGVDIFFVISGYLITRMILEDGKSTYSIVDFYNRRIRRLFPALFTVFFFCILVTFFTSFPPEARKIGNSIISSIFFVANYLFYSQSGYFDRNSETNPLLHTWSLSVEEQFYLLFPMAIYFMRNFTNRTRVLLLCAILVISLVYSAWLAFADPAAAFFLVQSRAWELLIGSLLAVDVIPKLTRQWQAEAAGLGGVALIFSSVSLISDTTAFPGITALAPCLGAAAVIHSSAATKTLVSRTLAFLPIRSIGLISYSIYLWHWPLIVFYRLIFVSQPTRTEKAALLAICMIVATVSWKFIEQPFRKKPFKLGAYGTLISAGTIMIVTGATCIALPAIIDSVFKYPARAVNVLSYAKIDESHMRAGTCFLLASDITRMINSNCLEIKPDVPNFLIVGDSHAAHLWTGLQTSYPGINFLQATVAGCTPTLEQTRSAICVQMMKYIFEQFIPRSHLDGVIIAARWKSDEILPKLMNLASAVRSYAGRVIIFGPIVEYDQALPRLLARAIASGQSETKFAELHRSFLSEKIDNRFSAAMEGSKIEYVSVYRAICPQNCEIWAAKNVPFQFDNSHLTCRGSIDLARKVGLQLFPGIAPADPPKGVCEPESPTHGTAAIN